MGNLPEQHTQGSLPVPTYDYFDSITGVGYVNFYPMVGVTGSGSVAYSLGTDPTIVSDSAAFKKTSTGELNFDILVEVPFTMAPKEAIFNYRQATGSGGSAQVVWTVYHVDADGNETSLGTVTGDDTGASTVEKKLCFVTLTKKPFKKGEKLRVSADITLGSNSAVGFDPAGLEASNDADGRSVTSTCVVRLPIIIRS